VRTEGISSAELGGRGGIYIHVYPYGIPPDSVVY
jgi:hypothetical protein